MTDTRLRPGLSFEVAPPALAHPLRTDIACFVGTVARRSASTGDGLRPMPVVLRRWLQSHRIERIGNVPVAQLRVSLDSAANLIQGLLSQADADASADASAVLPLGGTSERQALSELFDTLVGGSDQAPKFSALLAACRELSPLTEAVVEDLRQRELQPRGLLGTDELTAWLRVQCLHNLPVAIESFETFDALFAWERRGIIDPTEATDPTVRAEDPVLATPLGVALRAFFGEGGRRAYVIRTGDPSPLFGSAASRFAACFPEGRAAADPTPFDADTDRCAQIPGVRRQVRLGLLVGLLGEGRPPALAAADRVGLEHVYGLPDVSFAVLPDLIDACAQPVPAELPPGDLAPAPEQFVECLADVPPDALPAGRRLPPPRLNVLGLEVWRQLQLRALALLDNPGRAHHRRDVQLIASLPLLGDGRDLPAPSQWLAWMAGTPGWLTPTASGADGLLSDHLQLAYPWLRTADSADAQGGCEAPEGSLAGVLARSALERGAYRSAATRALHRYHDSEPALPWAQATREPVWTPLGTLTLAERVCLLGPSPRGPQLLSDVSCSADARTRQAAVRRLLNVVVQSARQAGDEFAFEANGERLWSRVRERLSDLMRTLLGAGALATDGVPFAVRCGRDTMQQNDIDAGRLIAQIELQPAQPVQRIVVVLNLRDAGVAPAFANAA